VSLFRNTQTNVEVAVLMGLESVSPKSALWLAKHETSEQGDISVQQVVWYAIGMAGAFAIAVLIYNALKTQAVNKNSELNTPAPLPAAG
jgi:hypothetical protein